MMTMTFLKRQLCKFFIIRLIIGYIYLKIDLSKNKLNCYRYHSRITISRSYYTDSTIFFASVCPSLLLGTYKSMLCSGGNFYVSNIVSLHKWMASPDFGQQSALPPPKTAQDRAWSSTLKHPNIQTIRIAE